MPGQIIAFAVAPAHPAERDAKQALGR